MFCWLREAGVYHVNFIQFSDLKLKNIMLTIVLAYVEINPLHLITH
jgi:hypothetical protein